MNFKKLSILLFVVLVLGIGLYFGFTFKNRNLLKVQAVLVSGDSIASKAVYCADEIYVMHDGMYYQVKTSDQKSGTAKRNFSEFIGYKVKFTGEKTKHGENCTPKSDCRCDERLIVETMKYVKD
jgi:ABC-type Fe3+/spermidine/putrescine transport system ATPase subunit